ncbi:uncharacterized protein LOC110858880 isoform X2 [Folsomia candida]|nr:uncharacterized protein LOC110858880 isoform X2 [Folsomia candida]
MGPSIILVLENASPDCTHVSDLLRDIINCQNFDMFVVVNSRGSNFSFPGKSIALNTFSDENGWEYAHFLLPRKNKADIVALCNIVDNIPLAISTVLACFKMERCGSLVLFNKTFKSDMDKRIAYYRTSQVDSTSYDGNIYAVIAHTLDLITKQDSGMHVKTILSFLICLRPTKVMRREDLQNFFLAVAEGVVDPEIEFDKALATLENYSLFVSDSDETNLVMHDVIFHVVLHHFGWHVEEDHLLFHVPRQVFQLLGNNFSKLSPRNQATFAIFVLNRMRNNKCVGVYRFGSLVIQM